MEKKTGSTSPVSFQDLNSFLAKYEEKSEDELLDILSYFSLQGDVHEVMLAAMARWYKQDPDHFRKHVFSSLKFSWVQYFDLEFQRTRSRTCFDPIVGLLLERESISIVDAIPYCKVFKVLVRVATDLPSLISRDSLENLAESIVRSKNTRRTVRITEIEYLKQLNLLAPGKSIYETAFSCVDTKRIYLLKYLVAVPGIATYQRDGSNLLRYSYSLENRCWWLKYASKDDIHRMILDSLGYVRCETLYPSVVLEVFKEIISKAELPKECLEKALDYIFFQRWIATKFIKSFDATDTSLALVDQPILLDQDQELLSLNRCRSNWRSGKFKVTYQKWKIESDVSSLTKVRAIDDNWAIAYTTDRIMLWNCHDHQKHVIVARCNKHFRCEILDSQPDRLPTLVQTWPTQSMVLYIDGNEKRYDARDTLGIEQDRFGYYSPIGRDKIITGSSPLVWSVELERVIGSVDALEIIGAKYNPLTGMTVLTHKDPQSAYTFVDKHYQVISRASRQKSINTSINSWMQWINEHQFVHVTEDLNWKYNYYNASLFVDTRMIGQSFSIEEHLEQEVVFPFYGSSFALTGTPYIRKRSIANVWDLGNRRFERVVVLPEDVRGIPVSNSRYAVYATTDSSKLCVLDWQ